MRHSSTLRDEIDRLATVEEVQLACEVPTSARKDTSCEQVEQRGWISTEELSSLSESELAYLFTDTPSLGNYKN